MSNDCLRSCSGIEKYKVSLNDMHVDMGFTFFTIDISIATAYDYRATTNLTIPCV